MTKTVSANLQSHLAQPTTTIASCLHITRTDGVEHFFTSHDQDITYGGDTYIAVGGYTASSIQSATGMSVDNLDLHTAIEDAGLTDNDIIAGRLDYATFAIFDLNYESIADGIITQRTGTIGQYSHADPEADLELRGLIQHLHQRIGRLMMKKCDADLGDAQCGINLATYTVTGTVSSVVNRQRFNVTSAPAARGGLFTFTSGNNDDLSMEVRSISGSQIDLALPMPFDVDVGDAYSVYRGCDKRSSTCNSVFSNSINFRGFPFLPGNDEIFKYPDAK